MARLNARRKDKNRFTKRYPFLRAPSRYVLETTQTIELEYLAIEFSNSSQESGFFESPFTDTNYRLMMSPRDTTGGDSANVALSVLDSLTDTSKVTITASAPFTGIVDVVAIRVEST